ncbi:tyrosine--tRNA ligase, partial [bacterium]|nr:tyrosine--tRNA ligase [bacterium]
MENVLNIFEERGFVEQITDRELVGKLLQNPTTCYIGFDPTAKSFHIGSLLPIMSLVHMQMAGHRPIVVIGGGTTLVGDPSGKTEMRPIITREEIDENAESLKKQISRFIDFSNGKAMMVNNADWLTGLNYIDFL